MHKLAILPAQRAEAPIIRDHDEVRGFGPDLFNARLALRSAFDQPAKHHHVLAQMIMDLPEMFTRRLLRLGHILKLGDGRTRGVVEKLNIFEQHCPEMVRVATRCKKAHGSDRC